MTSVEWLDEQIQERVIAQDVVVRKMIIEVSMEDYIEIKKQAKKQEKQDIISAYAFGHNDGCRYMTNEKQEFEHGESYYAETFKQD